MLNRPHFYSIHARRFTTAGYMWWRRNHAHEAAALAFYSLFSFIPILMIGIYVASLLVGQETATDHLLNRTEELTGFRSDHSLQSLLIADMQWFSNSYSPLIGAPILAFSATKVISELRRALSNIFGNPRYKKARHAALANLIGRAISLAIIISLGFVIASSVICESILNALRNHLHHSEYLLKLINYLSPIITLAAMSFLTTVIMRWLPKRPPRLKEAIYGSLVCSLLIVGLKYTLVLFLRHAPITNLFGGALTLVLFLLWIYFAIQVLLFSAEFTAILAKERRDKEELSAHSKAGA